MMGVTSGAGNAYPFGAPEFTSVFSGVRSCCSIFTFLYNILLTIVSFFYHLSFDFCIVCPFGIVASDYPLVS